MQFEIVTGEKASRDNPVECHAVVEAQSADDALLTYANAHRPRGRTSPYETWEQAAQDPEFAFAAVRAVPIEWYEPEVREATAVELQEYSRAFGLLGELDDASRERDRLAAACRESTGTERESNMRQLREAETDVQRIEGELSGASGGKATDEETESKCIGDELAALGDAVAVESELERAAPALKEGKNNRGAVQEWVESVARELLQQDDTTNPLAERIVSLAQRHRYESERGPITKPMVLRLLPPGLTGGRGRRSTKARKS